MRKCAVCGKEFDKYVPIDRKYIDLPKQYGRTRETRSELLNREEYSCPYCYTPDRDRMIVLFLKRLRACTNQGIDFLEIAPSGALQRYLYKEWGQSNLYTADLFMERVDYQADIQNMTGIADGTFDFIVCSHVLEHVQDDRKAMRELYRVLDAKGLGIIIVPLDLNQGVTDEEWGLSKEENIRRFGQEDHVRAYNKEDYVERLKESGFGVHPLNQAFFNEQEFIENALTETSTLYLVYKNPVLYGNLENVIENFGKSHSNAELKRAYQSVPGVCQYWIDLCTVEDAMLKMWGWCYIPECDSKDSKWKLMLEGETKEYIFGIGIRGRGDIQEQFGSAAYDYSCSGIDVQMPTEGIESGKYTVSVLVSNKGRKYRIEAAKAVEIG